MADTNKNWIDSALTALPGVLGGASQVILAEKGISSAPVTYVQAPAASAANNNLLIYGLLGVVAIIALFIIFK